MPRQPEVPASEPSEGSGAMTGFSLAVRGPVAGVTTVVPSGELDAASAPELESWLDDLRIRCASVVLDLSRLAFVDSSGLRALARARARATHARTALRFERPTPEVARALSLAGLDPQGRRAKGARLDPEVSGVPDLRAV